MDLITALDHSLRFDAEYGQRLANHLPMLLVALHRLGASGDRLSEASATYAQKLHAMPPLHAWPAGSPWREPLGQPAAWPAYRDLFTSWLHEEGAGDTLRQALPGLMPGCGAAAFHGMIRTAYAVDAAHRAELAHALAYWAARWLDLGVQHDAETRAPPPGTVADPAPLLRAAAAVPGVASSTSTYIAECVFHAGWQPGFADAVAGLRLDAGTLPRLARHAARLYARSGHFAVLHLATSAWALRVLLPFVEDLPVALAGYWRAYAAASASCAARLQLKPPPKPLPWPQLVERALASDDEHRVKLVHACQQEQQAYGGADDWQRAATRAVLAS
jgi:hypothetical protein